MYLKKQLTLFVCLFSGFLLAQDNFPLNGVYDSKEGHYAFVNGTLRVDANTILEQGTLLIKEGKIIASGKNITIPKEAVVIDLNGKQVYPSFIELSSNYGQPTLAKVKGNNGSPQFLSKKPGAYSWNQALKPEVEAGQAFTPNAKKAKAYRNLGFGTVLSHQRDGIMRGTAALALLGEERSHKMILNAKAAAFQSFNKGTSKQDYPSSRMGAIALLRQCYYDAKWYKEAQAAQVTNLSLEAVNANLGLPQFFELGNRLDLLRADKLGDEFGIQYIFRSGGDSYLRIEAIKQSKAALVVPLVFPKAYDLSNPFEHQEIGLTQLKHWELAPTNLARLEKAAIPFAITTDLLKDKKTFWAALRKAYAHGVSEKAILKALTETPAKLLKVEKRLGSLEAGKVANFFICSDNMLAKDNVIYENWVNGKPYHVNDALPNDIRGVYTLTYGKQKVALEIKGSLAKPELHLVVKKKKRKQKAKTKKLAYKLVQNRIHFSAKLPTSKKDSAVLSFAGLIEKDKLSGRATSTNNNWLNWTATKTDTLELKPSKLPEVKKETLAEITFPFSAYGYTEKDKPVAKTVLLKNCTVWTSEKVGVLKNTDVLIKDGKIAQIGKNLKIEGAEVVDGTGKHLTAGLIDEHSHICINYGVNEGTQASSAEVRIGDVVNSEDVNMYRQLAGGVTAAQLLHGSANPIGGQSALIKFRWGQLPEAIKIENADGFIKFALGENVKQSNWGQKQNKRFPQTRMGVEQVYEDFFTRANEYGIQKASGKPYRVDLELEALLEIINKKRFISCHSYVQSEITMLMRIAEKYDFTLNTFTHILEGYKIADKMKEHGAGASTFSDWWAYKSEVMDAIPYNAKILDAMGIAVAINSDDAEMGRRLNQEAAKSVKYGNMSEESALKMVTLNPAKLLHLDDRTGSIKEGKDADIVLWSDHPLSIYAKAEKTFVDGICLFDLEQDKRMRKAMTSERSRLIQKMHKAKQGGAKNTTCFSTAEAPLPLWRYRL